MALHRLSRDQVIWSFGPDLQPVLEVEPGDVVTFETNDCFSGQIRSEDDLVTGIDLGRINSATGPVAVAGAEPGDSLVAEILDVRPIEWGVATLIPGFGQLDHLVHAPLTRLFEVRDGMVKMNERVSFPARPMVGVVGVATAGETLATGLAGQHGGNLDDHWHGKGARIFFPVRQPGGMFAVGDMHAAMGDGEICGTGVEIQGSIELTVDVRRDLGNLIFLDLRDHTGRTQIVCNPAVSTDVHDRADRRAVHPLHDADSAGVRLRSIAPCAQGGIAAGRRGDRRGAGH